MTNSVFLKACAHCGSAPELHQWLDTLNPNATWIECVGCGLMTDTVYDANTIVAQRKAIERWNMRADNAQMFMVTPNGRAVPLPPFEVTK